MSENPRSRTDPLKEHGSVVKRGAPWNRRPRFLIALAVLAIVVGVLVVITRHSGDSGPGSATAKVGPSQSLRDYFAANGIAQTPVGMGEPGIPVITIPPPPGWSDSGPDRRPGIYAEYIYDNPSDPDDTPFVEVLLSRVEGVTDPARILEYAPGELRRLPGYRPISEPTAGELSGFQAVQLGGMYTKDGKERLIAQKTVTIPSASGLFVLQMNADAPIDDARVVQPATGWIDAKTEIKP